jgi:hypothetical protein
VAAELPAWIRELRMSLAVYPQVLLTGNVRDHYLLPIDGSGDCEPLTLDGVIERICEEEGFSELLVHDLVRDEFDPRPLGEGPWRRPQGLTSMAADESPEDRGRMRRILREIVTHPGSPIGLVFPYAARLGEQDPDPEGAARLLYVTAEALGHQAVPVTVPGRDATLYNTVFWVVERQEQLAAEFAVDSRRLRVISIPDPPIEQRLAAARHAVRMLPDVPPELAAQGARTLADNTHGMRNREILSVGMMARHQRVTADRLDEAARLYRIGVVDNPWAGPTLRRKIIDAEERLNRQVIGQTAAVAKTVAIFKRSAAGLTGAQSASSPNRPRGVLFLSGPTGVGKTELAKGIAQLILGDDAEPIRFDMSEFAQEHARERLIGAPPGYVGHRAGGELTNAVRAHPISVLLFDEIEKAHPLVFDLFLQILEDGRLTDGRGSTVHFTECMLIFTSNLGVAGRDAEGTDYRLTYTDDVQEVRDALRRAFDTFFDDVIRRPELRNRFGDGFVPMGFIQPDQVSAILDKSVRAVADRMRRVHRAEMSIDDEAMDVLRLFAIDKLSHGGRGINNAVEVALINPLSGELFDRPAKPGETITVTGFDRDGERWSLRVEREVSPEDAAEGVTGPR